MNSTYTKMREKLHEPRAELLTAHQMACQARLDAEAWQNCADKLAHALKHPDGHAFWHETELKALTHYERLKAKLP